MAPQRPRARRTADVGSRTRPAPRARPRSDFRFVTRGQTAALAAVERMIAGRAPQALLLVGPRSVGKTTLALDLAAGLLCHAVEAAARPCGACRSCRLVGAGEHQDLHRLAPEGPGRQVRIGDPSDPEPGTVRHLVRELARLPVEGARRVAVVEGADRLTEDAQHAFLKTLEEPPAGVTIVLCADSPERLLPTVRSRTAVLRLGPVAVRTMEELLAEHGVEPPLSGRLARLAEGKPGRAIALAAAPDAVAASEELGRSILDLVDAPVADRLAAARDLLARAGDLARAEAGVEDPDEAPGEAPRAASSAGSPGGAQGNDDRPARGAPAERRLAAHALVATWTAVARDLAAVATGSPERVRDTAMLDDLRAVASRVRTAPIVAFLDRLVEAARALEANANPELLVDVLVLAWPAAIPRSAPATAAGRTAGAP